MANDFKAFTDKDGNKIISYDSDINPQSAEMQMVLKYIEMGYEPHRRKVVSGITYKEMVTKLKSYKNNEAAKEALEELEKMKNETTTNDKGVTIKKNSHMKLKSWFNAKIDELDSMPKKNGKTASAAKQQ